MITLSLSAIVFELRHQLYLFLTVIVIIDMIVGIIQNVQVTVYFSLNFRHMTVHIGRALFTALLLYYEIR